METRVLSPTRIVRADMRQSVPGLNLQSLQTHMKPLSARQPSPPGRHNSPTVRLAVREEQANDDGPALVLPVAQAQRITPPSSARKVVNIEPSFVSAEPSGTREITDYQRAPVADEARLPYNAYEDDAPPSTEFQSWRRHVEGQLMQQNEFLMVLEPRMAKLEKHLPILVVEQDMLARVKKLEKNLSHLQGEDLHILESRLQQQASAVDDLQVDVARIGASGVFSQQCDALQSRIVDTEQMLAQLDSDLHALIGAVSSTDAKIRKLEHNWNITGKTHWEALQEDLRAQLDQQTDVRHSLQKERANGMEGAQANVANVGDAYAHSQSQRHMNLSHGPQTPAEPSAARSLDRSVEVLLHQREGGSGLDIYSSPGMPADVAIATNLDVSIQAELSKFPQFVVVDAVQKDLVKLPQLR